MSAVARGKLLLLAALAAALGAAAAAAAVTWPTDVTGTWVANGNGFVPHIIKLTQKNDKAKCKQIKGTLDFEGQPTQPVAGFYCPQSGRIVFTRVFDGVTIQVWQGQLSQTKSGDQPGMAGTFADNTSRVERPFLAAIEIP